MKTWPWTLLSAATLVVVAVLPTGSIAQVKYFELNNPDAIRLTRKHIHTLVSRNWYLEKMEQVIRGDTSAYYHVGGLEYKKDGTYSHRLETGKWSIVDRKYLKHTADPGRPPAFSGILSVTVLNDSSIVLTRLQSSRRDMVRIYYLRDKRPDRHSIVGNFPLRDRFPPTQKKVYSDYSRLDEHVVDSLSYLRGTNISQSGFDFTEQGELIIETRDSTYHIRLKTKEHQSYVKIFTAEDSLENFSEKQKRFTPTLDDISVVNSVVTEFLLAEIEKHDLRSDLSLNDQFKQYVGYYDEQGNKTVYMICFCEYHRNWKQKLIKAEEGGLCCFDVKVNLNKATCFDLRFN